MKAVHLDRKQTDLHTEEFKMKLDVLWRSRKPRLTTVRYPLRWPRDTPYPQKLALTSPTSGGRSVGIVRSRTKVTEFGLEFLDALWRMVVQLQVFMVLTSIAQYATCFNFSKLCTLLTEFDYTI
jgi:hypothetical protein